MIEGDIVAVDWRDARVGTGEPNKRRPGIVVSSRDIFAGAIPFEIVVPLTGDRDLAYEQSAVRVDPTHENGCAKVSFALSWAVQTVSHSRLRPTGSKVSPEILALIRMQIARCVGAVNRAAGTDEQLS